MLSFVVYSSETEIKDYININSLVVHLSDYLNPEEIAALNPDTGGKVIGKEGSRKDYLIKLLKLKDPKFISRFMKYLGSDSTGTNLYQLLQRSIDIYNKKISVVTISVSTSTLEYKE